MNNYSIMDIGELIKGNPYVGRGIVAGLSESGKYACAAYFIMGRSENSRNRVFAMENGALFTKAFDESKVRDPRLIIYAAMRQEGGDLIVTNGDQTDTIYNGRKEGKSFSEALKEREFEPDAPNFTPRISAILHLGGDFGYEMSILKSADEKGSACNRYTFDYTPIKGLGHFIHTYVTDGNPLPTFLGEPERVFIPDEQEKFAETLWNNLDSDNKISLFVRYIDLKSGENKDILINKNV